MRLIYYHEQPDGTEVPYNIVFKYFGSDREASLTEPAEYSECSVQSVTGPDGAEVEPEVFGMTDKELASWCEERGEDVDNGYDDYLEGLITESRKLTGI